MANETEEARNHAALTGHEIHSIGAIRQELRETRAQIKAVKETIITIEREIKQL